MPPIRVAEVLAALSLTTDLASGVPFEKGLATCAVATAFAGCLGLDAADRRAVYHAALLRSVGCTGYAVENAELMGDDVAFQAALKALDPGDPAVFGAQMASFGRWAGPAQPAVAQRFLEIAQPEGLKVTASACEVSRALGQQLDLPPAAVAALDDVWERWDGLGMPGAHSGEQLSLVARIVHLAEQVARVHAGAHELNRLCGALAIVVDLKGRFLLGHSAHVAELADAAARLAGVDAADRGRLHAAALLHDLGRAGVSSAVWDRDGPLGAADWERVRLHAYWTSRVLERCPGLAALAPVAGAHHERLDGTGYHRGAASADLPQLARLLGAADVFAALTEDRPTRPAHTPADAARELLAEAATGRLDRDACGAVVEAAGLPRPRAAWPCDLTDREVDVLRLTARGLSNRKIAEELVVSPRTVETHLAHIYDKTGRRTRAGAAVFAMEHDLIR